MVTKCMQSEVSKLVVTLRRRRTAKRGKGKECGFGQNAFGKEAFEQ